MPSKLVLSIAAALALSAAGGIARADGTSPAPYSPTNDEINAGETGVPASVDYPNRAAVTKDASTNDQINAAEAGSPDSIDNKDQRRLSTDGKAKNAWQKLESGNPHSTDRGG